MALILAYQDHGEAYWKITAAAVRDRSVLRTEQVTDEEGRPVRNAAGKIERRRIDGTEREAVVSFTIWPDAEARAAATGSEGGEGAPAIVGHSVKLSEPAAIDALLDAGGSIGAAYQAVKRLAAFAGAVDF